MKFTATLAAAALLATGAAQAQSAEDLLKKHACTACHAVDKKGVVPAYNDVAAKYKGDAKAAAMLAEKVKKGGSGKWGDLYRVKGYRKRSKVLQIFINLYE